MSSESLLKPILSADEVPGKIWQTRNLYRTFVLCFSGTKVYLGRQLITHCAVCVHGTYKKNLESILQSGLKRMSRLHVHFSSGLPTDGEVISGMFLCFYYP